MISKYLRYRRALLVYACLSAAVSFLIDWLMGGDGRALRYAFVLLGFLLLLFIIVDAVFFARRLRALTDMRQNLSAIPGRLPPAKNAFEGEYQETIAALYDLNRRQASAREGEREEQVAYYTMWLHQIKTPIAAMRLLAEGQPAGPTLEQELFRVERYVEMALNFAKLSEMQNDLVVTQVSLKKIVRAAVRKYRALFIAKKLSIKLFETDALVPSDEKWLTFIVEQLLSNAVKYTSVGHVAVEWDGEKLTVADTGIGIRKEDLPRVFERGYTGFNGRIDQRASGIGLYMASRAAAKLAIRLEIVSDLGKGTRVSLTFPNQLTEL